MNKKTVPAIVPPRSKFKLIQADASTPGWNKELGRIFRVGYYSRKDGVDCIWLVNERGEYEQTTTREYLLKYFEPLWISTETDFFANPDKPFGPLT